MRPIFSPDGTRIAVASYDHNVSVWTTTPLARIGGHRFERRPTSLAFSSDGKRLSVITEDGVAHVGDGESAPSRQVKIIDTYVTCTAFDPSSRWLAVGDDTKVRLWDTLGNDSHVVFDLGQQVQDVAFVNNGLELAIALFNSEVHLLDIGKKQLTHLLAGHTNSVSHVSEVPSGQDLITLGLDGTVRIWDRQRYMTRHVLRLTEQLGIGICSLAFSRDGHYIATGGDFNVAVWDTSTGKRIVMFPCPASVNDIVFSPDDRKLVASLDDQTIRIWTLNHLQIESSLAPAWTEALTGTRINDAGEVKALNAENWHAAKRLVAPWDLPEKLLE